MVGPNRYFRAIRREWHQHYGILYELGIPVLQPMQIPWYIGWPLAVAFGFGMLYIAASRIA
jgi:hypothetical protein